MIILNYIYIYIYIYIYMINCFKEIHLINNVFNHFTKILKIFQIQYNLKSMRNHIEPHSLIKSQCISGAYHSRNLFSSCSPITLFTLIRIVIKSTIKKRKVSVQNVTSHKIIIF